MRRAFAPAPAALDVVVQNYPESGLELMYDLAANGALKVHTTNLTVRHYQLKLHHQK